jgi:NAD(P)H-dependent flavin oxidoreductase YrpB (nitropropane dioxygenase family)
MSNQNGAQIVDAVGVPVAAAGGIADARGIAAAFALGAQGAQMRTVFLACEESGATALHRKAILSGKTSRTSHTRGFTGLYLFVLPCATKVKHLATRRLNRRSCGLTPALGSV